MKINTMTEPILVTTDTLKTSPWVSNVKEKSRVVDDTSYGNNLISGNKRQQRECIGAKDEVQYIKMKHKGSLRNINIRVDEQMWHENVKWLKERGKKKNLYLLFSKTDMYRSLTVMNVLLFRWRFIFLKRVQIVLFWGPWPEVASLVERGLADQIQRGCSDSALFWKSFAGSEQLTCPCSLTVGGKQRGGSLLTWVSPATRDVAHNSAHFTHADWPQQARGHVT